ncbi:MAG: hypothetical protein ACI4XL_10065 [Bacillus sp. (in: firmicutes)]
MNRMATALPKGLNQLPSSIIEKYPRVKEIMVIIKLTPKNKNNVMFLDVLPATIMSNRNAGNKKTASCLSK